MSKMSTNQKRYWVGKGRDLPRHTQKEFKLIGYHDTWWNAATGYEQHLPIGGSVDLENNRQAVLRYEEYCSECHLQCQQYATGSGNSPAGFGNPVQESFEEWLEKEQNGQPHTYFWR